MVRGLGAPRLFTLLVGVLAVYILATGLVMLVRGTYPYRDRVHYDVAANAVHLLRTILGVLLLLATAVVHIFTDGR